MPTIEYMTRKASKAKTAAPKQPEPERLPSEQFRIPGELAQLLRELAEDEWTTVPTQLVLAAKFYLKHKGKLPKAGETAGPPSPP